MDWPRAKLWNHGGIGKVSIARIARTGWKVGGTTTQGELLSVSLGQNALQVSGTGIVRVTLPIEVE